MERRRSWIFRFMDFLGESALVQIAPLAASVLNVGSMTHSDKGKSFIYPTITFQCTQQYFTY